MNVLLDAFYDLNYGDDIFIETVTGLFPHCKFYSFLEHYPQKVTDWAQKLPNLYLLPECDVFLQKNMFDAYICVGGDIFPDGGDFTKRKKYVQAVKEAKGTVIFWGFSLFDSYCRQTREDLAEMMGKADMIAPRDEASAAYLRQLLPDREITPAADLAFLSRWQDGERKPCLGISVRQPNYATEEDMAQYVAHLQEAIRTYLAGDPCREAVIFSLSDGNTSDTAVAEAILEGIDTPERVKHRVYTGDTAAVKQALAGCEVVICTRLHAMISCLAMDIPFIPIVYEVKMSHMLRDIGDAREQIFFRDTKALSAQLQETLASGRTLAWDREYVKTAVAVKERAEDLLRTKMQPVNKEDRTGPVCGQRQQLTEIYTAALEQRAADVATLEKALAQRNTDVATLEGALGEVNAQNQAMAQRLAELEALLPVKLYRKMKSAFHRQ